MKYASFAFNLLLVSALTFCLYRIGFLQLGLTTTKYDLDKCVSDLDYYRNLEVEYDECLENLRINSAEMRSAIERTTEYCRG